MLSQNSLTKSDNIMHSARNQIYLAKCGPEVTHQYMALTLIRHELKTWKNRYKFVQDTENMYWWKMKNGHDQSKSGQLFESIEECEEHAYIHWIKSNLPMNIAKEHLK